MLAIPQVSLRFSLVVRPARSLLGDLASRFNPEGV
jgi:hypothetical protein